MKFSVVIGNPPYSDRSSLSSNSANLDSVFFDQAMIMADEVLMVIRAKHFTDQSSHFRRKLFSSTLVSIKGVDPSTFPSILNTNTCVTHWRSRYGGMVEIRYTDGSTQYMNLISDQLIKINSPNFNPIIENNLSHRWIRGKLIRHKIVSGDSPMVEICGKGTEPVITMIEKGLEITGQNQYGVVMNIMSEWGGLGKVMIKPYEASISNSVILLQTDTEEDAIQLKEYLESSFVKALVKQNMKSCVPSKSLFQSIPDIKEGVSVLNM